MHIHNQPVNLYATNLPLRVRGYAAQGVSL
jgi:hypothetical protein